MNNIHGCDIEQNLELQDKKHKLPHFWKAFTKALSIPSFVDIQCEYIL